jgi:hypothetical protein
MQVPWFVLETRRLIPLITHFLHALDRRGYRRGLPKGYLGKEHNRLSGAPCAPGISAKGQSTGKLLARLEKHLSQKDHDPDEQPCCHNHDHSPTDKLRPCPSDIRPVTK